MSSPPTSTRFHAIVAFHQQREGAGAVLRCAGDEDRGTQGRRRGALSRAIAAESDVVVDLSELVFADTSLMLDLAMLSRRLRCRGGALWLRGAQPQIRTLIELVGLHRLPGVRIDVSPPAFA